MDALSKPHSEAILTYKQRGFGEDKFFVLAEERGWNYKILLQRAIAPKELQGQGSSSGRSLSILSSTFSSSETMESVPEWRRDFPLIDDFIRVGAWTWAGFMDASRWLTAFSKVRRSPKIQAAFFKCVVLNGVVFLGSLVVFEVVVLPMAKEVLGLNVEEGAWMTESLLARVFNIADGALELNGGKPRPKPERNYDK
ncbi:hypothetical protein HDU93_006728 [Gonapodya sp. JEL0774]|nr:hypothetical protein HDU93_006728 [Gonapodya sp. JEL0774]